MYSDVGPFPALQNAPCLATLDVPVIAGAWYPYPAGLGRHAKTLGADQRPAIFGLSVGLVKRIVLSLGYWAQAVVDFLDRHRSSYEDQTVVTVTEPRPLGTAGGIRFARPNLRTDPVLVMNGDSFADADLCAFVAHHRRAGAKATLLCAEVDSSAPTEWSRWNVSLELVVAPAVAWPAELVDVAQPATRRMLARTLRVLVACSRAIHAA